MACSMVAGLSLCLVALAILPQNAGAANNNEISNVTLPSSANSIASIENRSGNNASSFGSVTTVVFRASIIGNLSDFNDTLYTIKVAIFTNMSFSAVNVSIVGGFHELQQRHTASFNISTNIRAGAHVSALVHQLNSSSLDRLGGALLPASQRFAFIDVSTPSLQNMSFAAPTSTTSSSSSSFVPTTITTTTSSTSTTKSTARTGWFFNIQKPKEYEHRFRVDGNDYFATSKKALAVGRRLCHSTTTSTMVATMTTTTHAVGSFGFAGQLYFQVCGSWNASVRCEWQKTTGAWAPFTGGAHCSYHVCQCSSWTYTAETVPVRISVNSFVHYTSQSQAVATGKKDCSPTTTSSTTTTTTTLQPVGAVNTSRGVVSFQLCGSYFIYCDMRRQGDMHWWQFGYATCRPDTICECPALTEEILQQYEDHRTTTITATTTTTSFTVTLTTITTSTSTTSIITSTSTTTNASRAILDSQAGVCCIPCSIFLACLLAVSLTTQSAK